MSVKTHLGSETFFKPYQRTAHSWDAFVLRCLLFLIACLLSLIRRTDRQKAFI